MCCSPCSYSIVLRTVNGRLKPDDIVRWTTADVCPLASVPTVALFALTS